MDVLNTRLKKICQFQLLWLIRNVSDLQLEMDKLNG